MDHQLHLKPGVADIAREAGVSIGTVDRALHNRPGINWRTKARILEIAARLGYHPDPAARALASKQRRRILSVLPSDPCGFFPCVVRGIQEEAHLQRASGISVEFRSYPWLKDGEAEAIARAVNDGFDGLIIAPGSPETARAAIAQASAREIPVVSVTTDAPGTGRLSTVLADSHSIGSIAAELIGRVLWGRGSVGVITGSTAVAHHAEALRAFRQTLSTDFPSLVLLDPIEAHDDAELAYTRTIDLLRATPDLGGLYVGTSNSLAVLHALDHLQVSGRVALVTMDLFPELAERIRDGTVLASIHQRPRNQGRTAFRALQQYLAEGVRPPAEIALAPHIVLRANLDLLLKRGLEAVLE
jgi:LacI family transcriptional regulator